MYGIFVNENGGIHYAEAIVSGIKPIETRSRNMLKSLVGERVAIIRTRRNSKPTIIGYADIDNYAFCPWTLWEMHRDETLIPPGSQYDIKGRGKWMYYMSNPEKCEPYELPTDAVRHGRSYAEWTEVVA